MPPLKAGIGTGIRAEKGGGRDWGWPGRSSFPIPGHRPGAIRRRSDPRPGLHQLPAAPAPPFPPPPSSPSLLSGRSRPRPGPVPAPPRPSQGSPKETGVPRGGERLLGCAPGVPEPFSLCEPGHGEGPAMGEGQAPLPWLSPPGC